MTGWDEFATEAPEESPSDWPGEAKVAGRALEVGTGAGDSRSAAGKGEAHTFHVDLTEVVVTTVTGDQLVIESWHQGRGVQKVSR